MLHHIVVILIIAVPLGLFAAIVATACQTIRSDLGRAALIGVAMLPILITGAWELSLVFWLTAALCSLMSFVRSLVQRRGFRPTIQTLMASTFLAALTGLIVNKTGLLSRQEVIATLLAAVAFSVWSTQGVSLAHSTGQMNTWSRKRWVGKYLSMVLVGFLTALMLAWRDQFACNLNSDGSWPPFEANFPWLPGLGNDSLFDLRWLGIWIAVTLIGFACARMASRWFPIAFKLRSGQINESSRWFQWRWWLGRSEELLIALTVLVCFGLCWVLIRPSGLLIPPSEPTLAFQRTKRISRTMQSELVDVSMLDAKVATDRKQFDVQAFLPWRKKLTEVIDLNSMQVPLTGSESDIDTDGGVIQRGLARTLVFAAECQIENRELEEAVQTLKTALRWSVESRRGGLLIQDMIGSACGGVFLNATWHHRNEFSNIQCEELVAELTAVIIDREDVATIIRRDEAWVRSAFGWFGRLQQFASRWEDDPFWWSIDYNDIRKRETASLRLTALELMLACHYREHQQYPNLLDELVWPSELVEVKQAMMQDPFLPSGKMVYRREGTTYLLYSVGVDGLDQDGINSDWMQGAIKSGDDIQLKVMFTDK